MQGVKRRQLIVYGSCSSFINILSYALNIIFKLRGRRCHDHMVVTISATTTKVVSSNPTHGEVYLIQYYATKFVSDLLQ